MDEGKFRKDLYYRLSVIPFEIPSFLNARTNDIEQLAFELLQKHPLKVGKFINYISREVLDVFKTYH